jgi:hypothetical protein
MGLQGQPKSFWLLQIDNVVILHAVKAFPIGIHNDNHASPIVNITSDSWHFARTET